MNDKDGVTIVNFIGKPKKLVGDYNGWKLYGFEIDNAKYPDLKRTMYGTLSVVGNIPELSLDIDYNIEAEESMHDKYGWQYKVTNISRDQPIDAESTRSFLNEILTPDQANEIVRHYPDIIDRIINNKSVDLSKIYNIKEKRFKVIKRKIIENFGLMKLVDKFGKYGINFEIIKKIYDDCDTIEDVLYNLKHKPYDLLCKIPHVGFKKADLMLLKIPKEEMGWKEDLLTSGMRMSACIKFLLEEQMREGHTKYYINKIKNTAERLTPECMKKFDECSEDKKYILDDQFIGLGEMHLMEKYIASFCKTLFNNSYNLSDNIDYEQYRNISGITLTDEQMKTLKFVNKYNISILTAIAGCGKSASSKAVIQMLKD